MDVQRIPEGNLIHNDIVTRHENIGIVLKSLCSLWISIYQMLVASAFSLKGEGL